MSVIFGGPGRYIQGPGELENLANHVAELGTHALIVIDSGGSKRVGDRIAASFESHRGVSEPVFRVFDGPCTELSCTRVARACRDLGCDVVVGVGGGKMLDIAKAAAHFTNLPLCVCPTVASTDAPCSAISVLYNEDGSFDRYLHLRRNPDLVVVDSAVIAHAPVRMLVAGMGDALATYFEARACAKAAGVNELGGGTGAAALALARGCFDTLMADGAAAKADVEHGELTPAVERVIECNILLSGIGFESGGLALAHAVANGLASLPDAHIAHGEAVSFGLGVELALEKALQKERKRVSDFCHEVGLPTTLAELGLDDVDAEQLERVAQAALACERNIANEPVSFTAEDIVKAMRA